MIKLTLKEGIDPLKPSESGICLGYREIKLLFNLGPFPDGGNCIFVGSYGKIDYLNSNDIIHDLEFYEISTAYM